MWIDPGKSELLLSGALGGVVRWLTLRDHWSDGIVAIIVGAICALYLAPLAVPSLSHWVGDLGVADDSVSGLSGFLIGLGGITVSGLVMDLWRAKRRAVEETKGDKSDK